MMRTQARARVGQAEDGTDEEDEEDTHKWLRQLWLWLVVAVRDEGVLSQEREKDAIKIHPCTQSHVRASRALVPSPSIMGLPTCVGMLI